jgi:hypothetical protein
MDLPPESERIGSLHDGLAAGFRRCVPPEGRMSAMPVVVLLELAQLPIQVPGIPK